MDLPSSRELELEIALRERDAQLAHLTDQVSHLRQSLSTQPGPSTTDPITLPPAFVSVLLPHINRSRSGSSLGDGTVPQDGGSIGGGGSSSTVTAALMQRVRLLQDENDELYNLLKHGETGRLKEEVLALRRAVDRLEGALRESHQVITSLSSELNHSYETFFSSNRPKNSAHLKPFGRSPRNSHHNPHQQPQQQPQQRQQPIPRSTTNGTSKLPPTGPRAHKKPRLSEVQVTSPPTARSNVALPSGPSSATRPSGGTSISSSSSAKTPLPLVPNNSNSYRPDPQRERDRVREMDQEMDRGRDRDRDREREESPPPRRRSPSERDKGVSKAAGGGSGGSAGRANAKMSEMEDDQRKRPDSPTERNAERDRDRRDRNRDRDRDRKRDRDRDRERERERDRERVSRRSGNRAGGGRRGDRGSGADRTLAERMGL